MPHSSFKEESFLFVRVESLCRGAVVTCTPELDVVAMAGLMRQHDVSGLVVVEDGQPVGIVSVRDCRDLIAAAPNNLATMTVREIMTVGLVSLRPRDQVFDAVFKMAKHNIHRLVVLDEAGKLVGIITDTDLLRLQTRTPLYLNQELENADSIEQLRQSGKRLFDMVRFASRAGADTRSLVELISHFNDVFTRRLVVLLDRDEGIRLPQGAAYLALGSEGRGEQTLRTDQDSAIVYADSTTPTQLREIECFSTRLVDALEAIGVPRCPGNTMASNPYWRRSLSGWKELLDQWMQVPKPENMVNFGMFQDLRCIHGDTGLERQLRDHIHAEVDRNALFLAHMARNIVRFKPPLGFFGRIKVESWGEHRDEIDLKKSGIFTLTLGASLLTLEAGSSGGSTWEKFERLRRQGTIAPVDLDTIEESFTYLVQLRIEKQLRAIEAGKPPSNYLNPLVLTEKERAQLRAALKGAGTFLRILRDRFQLDLIAR